MTTRPKFSPELMEKILGCSAYDLREFPPRFASAKEMLEDRMVSVLSACAVRALRDPEDARPQKEVVLLHRGQLDKGFQEVFLRGFGLPKVDARLYYLLTDCFYAWLKIPVAYPWGDLWVSAEGASLLQPKNPYT